MSQQGVVASVQRSVPSASVVYRVIAGSGICYKAMQLKVGDLAEKSLNALRLEKTTERHVIEPLSFDSEASRESLRSHRALLRLSL